MENLVVQAGPRDGDGPCPQSRMYISKLYTDIYIYN